MENLKINELSEKDLLQGDKLIHVTCCDDVDGLGCELIDKFIDMYFHKIYRAHECDFTTIIANIINTYSNPVIIITGFLPTMDVLDVLDENIIKFIWITHHRTTDEVNKRIAGDTRFLIYPDKYKVSSTISYCIHSGFMKNQCMKVSTSLIYLFAMQNFIPSKKSNVSRLAEVIMCISLDTTHEDKNVDAAKFEAVLTLDDLKKWYVNYTWLSLLFKEFGPDTFIKIISNYIKFHTSPSIGRYIDAINRSMHCEYQLSNEISHITTYCEMQLVIIPYQIKSFSYCANKYLKTYPNADGVAEVWSESQNGEISYHINMISNDLKKLNCGLFCKEHFNGSGYEYFGKGTLTKKEFDTFQI